MCQPAPHQSPPPDFSLFGKSPRPYKGWEQPDAGLRSRFSRHGLPSRAEQRGADTHQRRALFHRDFKIIGHAHGEFVHMDALQWQPADQFGHLFEALEIRPHQFGGRIPRRNRHEPLHAHGREGVDLRDGRRQRVGRKPAFGFFASNIDFEQDGLGRVSFMGPSLNLLSLLQGFHRMNEGESTYQPLEFSSLKPADEVPLDVPTFTHRLHFGLCFLPAVFSADGQTNPDGIKNP